MTSLVDFFIKPVDRNTFIYFIQSDADHPAPQCSSNHLVLEFLYESPQFCLCNTGSLSCSRWILTSWDFCVTHFHLLGKQEGWGVKDGADWHPVLNSTGRFYYKWTSDSLLGFKFLQSDLQFCISFLSNPPTLQLSGSSNSKQQQYARLYFKYGIRVRSLA